MPVKHKFLNKRITDMAALIFCILVFTWVLCAFTGQWPWSQNPYNSYTLQACSWLQGRLDLGRNYEYLELAVYHGKYFVSFPPFPSFIMLPFALFFGEQTPDGWIALFISIAGAVYTLKLFWLVMKSDKQAFFWTLFLVLGTNLVFIRLNGWVWFIAQNLCFLLSVMALYYARKGKAGLSLALWACSVGTRPLQILYLPVLLYIIWQEIKPLNQEKNIFVSVLKKRYACLIPMLIIACTYMALNLARFGNVTEFGHNYLPEFTEAANGQFNLHYIAENVKNLFRLPAAATEGKLDFYTFNGFAFWLASPLFISWLYYMVRGMVKKSSADGRLCILILAVAVVHAVTLLSHKTMGGWHFGNRYLNDLLPYVFFSILLLLPRHDRSIRFQYGLFILGMALNVVGTAAVYNYWI